MTKENPHSIPFLDLSLAKDSKTKSYLLRQLHAALFDVGILYIVNHDVPVATISHLTDLLPTFFDLPAEQKASLSKLNISQFLGYSEFAKETTLGKQDSREQFDFATELPAIHQEGRTKNFNAPPPAPDSTSLLKETDSGTAPVSRDFTQLYWRLRGPNQWPDDGALPGFRKALTDYHDVVEALSYRFVHLIEEAFGIPLGTFDHFFGRADCPASGEPGQQTQDFLPPQHHIKLLRYPPSPCDTNDFSQGVDAHKDSSGWLTFLYQVGDEKGFEFLSSSGEWLSAPPIPNTFVVNFGNAFEAATDGAVKATIHRVLTPGPESNVRYSTPFFMGLPLDMTVNEIREYIPEHVKRLHSDAGGDIVVSDFLGPRWDSLGESQLRKWIRSHKEVGEKWYGQGHRGLLFAMNGTLSVHTSLANGFPTTMHAGLDIDIYLPNALTDHRTYGTVKSAHMKS